MMYSPDNQTVIVNQGSAVSVNSVLRKTYALLGGTLIFSALMALLAMAHNAPPLGIGVTLIGYFGLLFLTQACSKSKLGLLCVFAFTGFMGYTLGPILNMYIREFSNGGQLVSTALGATGLIFFSLSAYALITKKDFSYLGAFVFIGITVAFIAGLVGLFFHAPIFSLLVSGAFVLLSSGLILFQTSMIINGGERNYIMATITLFVALLNIFMSLLQIFGAFGGRRS